jgi:hypothetical protein
VARLGPARFKFIGGFISDLCRDKNQHHFDVVLHASDFFNVTFDTRLFFLFFWSAKLFG